MTTCIVVDDELNAREALEKLIQRYFPDKLQVVCLAASVQDAVQAIHKYNPGLVFLDIEMPGENGFKLFDYFDQYTFEVIFTTAYKQYAIHAIKHAALDYLLKPVNFADLQEAVQKLEKKIQVASRQARIETLLSNLSMGSDIMSKVALPTLTGYQMERINNIMYCEADENYTRIHLVPCEVVVVPKTLKIIQELLPSETFFRVHKSYLVNLNYVKKYTKTDGHLITLEDGTVIDVAARRNEEFIRALTRRSPSQ